MQSSGTRFFTISFLACLMFAPFQKVIIPPACYVCNTKTFWEKTIETQFLLPCHFPCNFDSALCCCFELFLVSSTKTKALLARVSRDTFNWNIKTLINKIPSPLPFSTCRISLYLEPILFNIYFVWKTLFPGHIKIFFL
jgi:hypothetical protein